MYQHCRNVCASNSTASIPLIRSISKDIHLVFEMFYSKQREKQEFVDQQVNTVNTNPQWIRSISKDIHPVDTVDTRFIRYSQCTIEDREMHVGIVDTRWFE